MTQMYFDRDGDYVRRAQRKLKRLKSNKLTDAYGTYTRVVELCDKAINVNDCNFDAYFLKAQTLVKMRRYAEAIEEFNNALSIKNDIVNRLIDIQPIVSLLRDETRVQFSLQDMKDFYNIEGEVEHHALSDARDLKDVMLRFIDTYKS